MPVRVPQIDDLYRIAEANHLALDEDDLESFRLLIAATLASYEEVDRLVEPDPLRPKYPRTSGYRPAPEDNPLNAWYWRCEIKGAPEGKLAGKRIAIKDNTCVAGVPMMNGSATLEGYVPEVDATVVARILEAGGEIVGKAVCEDLCFSGGSHTPATGPILNPHDHSRSAGGSSGGSSALVAAGEVDMATGGDQGGSIRIPSCWCGTVGHKPTYGLVPYTGIFPIELTLDHTGPIASTAEDAALMLEAMAGRDGLDPRQPTEVPTEAYSETVHQDISGLRIGVLTEGFGWDNSERDVDHAVQDGARMLEKVGAEVRDISIPFHRKGIHIWTAVGIEGATALMLKGNALGTNWKGFYTRSLLDVFARGLETRANDLSETNKMTLLLGEYLKQRYHGRYYAKGQNLGSTLRAQYDEALQEVDVLVLPTLPMKATPIPAPDGSREEYVSRALEMIANTCPFDVTGHPATSVPCGKSGNLPIGMMIVGRHFEDGRVLATAQAVQELVA